MTRPLNLPLFLIFGFASFFSALPLWAEKPTLAQGGVWNIPPGWSGVTHRVEPVPEDVPVTVIQERAASAPTSILKKYVIQEDDTLWDLAGEFYGKPWLWPLFLKFNSISNPDLIHPGQALLFPGLDVLLGIKEKTPEEVKEIRETMEKQNTPIVVAEPPSAPEPQKVSKPVTETEKTETPTPVPLKTPTFKITGSKTINMSYSEALGGTGPGLTNTGYDRHETLKLQMEGQLNDDMKILGHFAQSDLALEDDYDLTLTTKHWEFFLGNFSPSLPGSQYLSSTLTSTGVKATGHYDDWDVTAFYATPQGRPVYQKFFGNNSQGPYTAPGGPFVPGSETIWINKVKLTRGVDYNLDYTIGYLTFINRIISLTDLVEIQAVSSGATFKTQLYGYRTELALVGKVSPPASPAPVAFGAKSGVFSGPATSLFNVPSASASAPVTGLLVTGMPVSVVSAPVTGLPAAELPAAGQVEAKGNTVPAQTASAGSTASGGSAASGPKWVIGQGYLRQFEQPDANTNTATGRVAGDTHMVELDTTLDFGPPLKLSGEVDGSYFISSNTEVIASKGGGAYRAQGDTFQGPFHLQGKISGTSPFFTTIGNPLISKNFLEWGALGDFKEGDSLFAQADRTFQRTYTSGARDETTTDHAEAKVKPKNFLEMDYVYYLSREEREDPVTPFKQEDLKNTLSLGFGLPASISCKLSALQESQTGNNLGTNHSYGGRLEIASQKWKAFNFSVSGEWKLTDVVESGSNTTVPQSAPGNNIPSQSYTYTLEGKPFDHLSLTGKGTYSDGPPGPPKANITQNYQTDPFKWLNSNGSYSLDFQQALVLGAQTPDQIHTATGSLEMTPMEWLKLTAQPSFRMDVLPGYGGQTTSKNFHQNYRAALTPSFGNLNGDYTFDQFWTWDATTAGFPLNFEQQSETINVSAKKPLGKVNVEASYKRVDQNQSNISAVTVTSTHSLNQTENDSLNWTANSVFTFTVSHSFNQLNQDAPGQGVLANPLLPNGSDTFNSNFTTNAQNAYTCAHTFTGRVTEQLTKTLSFYEEGGYTHTSDVLRGGTVQTYSPAVGFTWRPGSFLNWTGSYQYNGSSGQVSTTIQKAQTTLSATLNASANLSASWNWTRADNPFVLNQQGNVSYTMNF